MTSTFSHFGISVTDVDRSLRFYCGAFGFEPGANFDVGPEFGGLMELDAPKLRSQYIVRDGLSIELLGFASPRPVPRDGRREMNRVGLTHLSFRVDDVDAVAAKVVELGGEVHPHTRTTMGDPDAGGLDFVYCTDPDGTRIELMRLPG
jgi:catechol 2,3-dioxygenase-like lactoylglutathione lyase family enzyme